MKLKTLATTLVVLLMVNGWALSQRSENGIVTGQLLNPNGAPAPSVRVMATALPETGVQGGTMVSLTETDSNGRYRLENIPPGRYYIQAGLVDNPNYYPGVATASGATSVQVTAGATVSGIDFRMIRAAGVRVSGRISPSINPKPGSVRLLGGAPITGMPVTSIGSDGYFEFLRVPPGDYTVMVAPSHPLLPGLPIKVENNDVSIGVSSGPGVKVNGVVGLGPHSPRPANLRVTLTGDTPWNYMEASVNSAGEFEFPSVTAGNYSVRTIPGQSAEISNLVVANREIPGLLLPALVELSGKVTIDDGTTLPPFPTALMIEAKSSTGAPVATAAGRDGVLRLPMLEGEYRFSTGALPAGYVLKSFLYGSTDLLASPVRLDGTLALSEIRVVLVRK